MNTPAEFERMRSYEDGEIRQAVRSLFNDPAFCKMLRRLKKGLPLWLIKLYAGHFRSINSFQKGMILPFVKYILKKSTGLTHDLSAVPRDRQDVKA